MPKRSEAARLADYRTRQARSGLHQLNVRVPPDAATELQIMAAFLRDHRDVSFVPVVRLPNGRLLFLR